MKTCRRKIQTIIYIWHLTRFFYLVDIIVYFVELDEDVRMKNECDVLYYPK